ARCQLCTTSCAVNGEPSWKVTPCRRWNVYVSPSGEMSQRRARAGSTLALGSKRVSPSKRYATARPVGTSVESAGSSDRGSYWSRESTSVWCDRGPLEPHAARDANSAAATTNRSVPSIDTGKLARELTRSRRQASIRCARRRLCRAGALYVGTATRRVVKTMISASPARRGRGSRGWHACKDRSADRAPYRRVQASRARHVRAREPRADGTGAGS